VLSVAALSGACTMTVELAAVRLIAPWFGTSSAVWTNVIGIVLLALSSGYLLGARLSRRSDPRAALGVTLLVSAACAAWLPELAGPVCRFFLPAGLALDEAAALLQWGSLATALILFLPSALLLGCTPPLASEIVQRYTAEGAGSSGGRILAASTVGSLGGTFSTTYLALPVLGLTHTFLFAGSLLGALGVCVLVGRRPMLGGRALILIAFVLAAWWGARLRMPDAPSGFRILESAESAYQSSRIIEGEVDGRTQRRLQVNEGFDSFQSVWQEEAGLLPMGYYYNYFALPPWWSEHRSSWKLLVLGLASGTTWRVLEGELPRGTKLESTGVEIDPVVVRLGERWMQLPRDDSARRVLSDWDARAVLRQMSERFDEVVLDAYANQMEIPAHLTTEECFGEVRAHLVPGGWLCINIGSFGLSDPLVEAIGTTVARAFGERALAVRVPFSRNCVLFAREGIEPTDPNLRNRGDEPAEIRALFATVALPGAFRWFDGTRSGVLTDDLDPIEELQRRSIREAQAHWLERP
jgi:spermidine synthase